MAVDSVALTSTPRFVRATSTWPSIGSARRGPSGSAIVAPCTGYVRRSTWRLRKQARERVGQGRGPGHRTGDDRDPGSSSSSMAVPSSSC